VEHKSERGHARVPEQFRSQISAPAPMDENQILEPARALGSVIEDVETNHPRIEFFVTLHALAFKLTVSDFDNDER